jgi:hypothetical protein
MHQVQLALGTHHNPVDDSSPQQCAAFEIGWDHAHHGLVPEPGLLLADSPIGQGWLAGRAVFGGRTLSSTHFTRQWLQWRTLAWRNHQEFDKEQLSPNFLQQIQAARCPASLQLLQGLPGRPDSLVLERLNPTAGFVAGNVAQMSQAAALAWQGLTVMDLVRRARAQEQRVHTDTCSPDAPTQQVQVQVQGRVQGRMQGQSQAQPSPDSAHFWWRLATLRAFATPLPFAEAARLPLALLPPNRVRLRNDVQALQALLSLNFMKPGWASRCSGLGKHLPEHSLRQDFNLFIGAMAPRVIEAGSDSAALRSALENAWCQERVQRRWTHLVLSLGERGTEALLQQAASADLAGKRTLYLSEAQAIDGWGLAHPKAAAQGSAAPRRALPLPPGLRPRPAHRPKTAGSRLAPGSDGSAHRPGAAM